MTAARVLIIEDSPYLAESLIDLLELRGHTALHAPSGTIGIKQALAEQPDLILLDIRLPDITGYEVLQRLRESDWGRTANIIILTASESVDDIAQHIALPAEQVLFKPEWSMQALATKIDDVLSATAT